MTEEIKATTRDGVMEVRIDRPAKKNALTTAMYAAMADALEQAERATEVRVVIIAGGQGMFTAGNDLNDFLAETPAGGDRPVARFMRALLGCSKIVIAAVDGVAVGIGTTLLLHCDLVVASPTARFSLPFVNLALVPEFASSMRLPQLIGRQRAAKHLILGEPFDAQTALDYGVVSEIALEGAALDVARDMARKIAAKAPEAVRATKRLMTLDAHTIEERMAVENEAFARQLPSPEAKEAMSAILEKRQPSFQRQPEPASA